MSKEKLKEKNHTSYFAPHTSNKGITLIALIITIIVMMILVAVTVTFTIGENGILSQAKESGKLAERAQLHEQIMGEMKLTNEGKIIIGESYTAAKEMLSMQDYEVGDFNQDDGTFEVTGKKGTYKYKITETEITIEENVKEDDTSGEEIKEEDIYGTYYINGKEDGGIALILDKNYFATASLMGKELQLTIADDGKLKLSYIDKESLEKRTESFTYYISNKGDIILEDRGNTVIYCKDYKGENEAVFPLEGSYVSTDNKTLNFVKGKPRLNNSENIWYLPIDGKYQIIDYHYNDPIGEFTISEDGKQINYDGVIYTNESATPKEYIELIPNKSVDDLTVFLGIYTIDDSGDTYLITENGYWAAFAEPNSSVKLSASKTSIEIVIGEQKTEIPLHENSTPSNPILNMGGTIFAKSPEGLDDNITGTD